MAIVNFKVKHINYQLSYPDSQQDNVSSLLQQTKSQLDQLSAKAPHANDGQLLIMHALNLQEQLNNYRKANPHIESSDLLVNSLDAISEYIETLANKLENS